LLADLHRFDGAIPRANLTNVNGTLYGTTQEGGVHGHGTIFSVSASGSVKLLHAFSGGTDGARPEGALLDVNGTLYGTTVGGGSKCRDLGCGTVFSISITGSEKVLYRFKGGSDGAAPAAGLIAVDGVLYGTTMFGGGGSACRSGCGTVFRVTTTGAEEVVHRFAIADGYFPQSSLTYTHGAFFGATYVGGAYHQCGGSLGGCGTIYRLTRTGSFKVLHSFAGADGSNPLAALIGVNGTLYGTTSFGGPSYGGTLFSITLDGSERMVYGFGKTPTDGLHPWSGVVELDGKLFGTTRAGGNVGTGTVYQITLSGHETVLHNFGSSPDGKSPMASLVELKGIFYGTSSEGGGKGCRSGCGSVYQIE